MLVLNRWWSTWSTIISTNLLIGATIRFLIFFTFFFLSFSLFLVGWPSLLRLHSLHQLLDEHFQPPPTLSPQEPAGPTTAQPSTVAFQPLWEKIKECAISGSSTWVDILVVNILFDFLLFPRLQFPETEAVSEWRSSSSSATHPWTSFEQQSCSICSTFYILPLFHYWSLRYIVLASVHCSCWPRARSTSVVGELTLCTGDIYSAIHFVKGW